MSYDPSNAAGWSDYIVTCIRSGITLTDFTAEAGACAPTVVQWIAGVKTPREGTRRLMVRAFDDLIEKRRGSC